MKKALEFSMVMLLILLAGVFLVTSCSNPSDGRDGYGYNGGDGQNGADGGYFLINASYNDEELAKVFELADKAIVATAGTVNIYGEVPAGKALYVLSGDVRVAAGETLLLAGTLEIEEDGTFKATGYTTAGLYQSGYLTSESVTSNIIGAGKIYLPVAIPLDSESTFENISYADVNLPGKVAKTVTYGTAGSFAASVLLTEDHITEIFEKGITDDELTVEDVVDIRSANVPAGTTLTLLSTTYNTLGTNTPSKFEPVGSVIIKGELRSVSPAIDIHPVGSITIEDGGTFALVNAGDKVVTGRGTVTNSGTISTSTVTIADLKTLLGLDGGGTIETTGTLNLGTDTVALAQNLKIAGNAVLTVQATANPVFSGAGKVTVAGTAGVLAFGATAITNLGGVEIETINDITPTNGTVTTGGTQTELNLLLLGVKGTISSTAAVALTGTLNIPEDVILTTPATTATFTGAQEIKVYGTARFGAAATFANISTITVEGNATFGAAPDSSTGDIVVDGGTAIFSVALTTITGDITIKNSGDATFTGSVVPAVIVQSGATATFDNTPAAITDLTVDGSTSTVSIEDDTTITALAIINGGTVEVDGDLTLSDETSINGSLDVTGDFDIGANALTVTAGTLNISTTSSGTGAGVVKTTGTAKFTVGGTNGLTVTLPSSGIGAGALTTALGVLAGDLLKLNNAVTNLATTYSTVPSIPVTGAGGATIGVINTDTNVITGLLSDDITPDATDTAVGTAYSQYNSSPSGITWKIDSGNLSVKASAYDGGGDDKVAIYNISGVRLTEDDVSVTVPDFRIGVSVKQ
jgi:hypothetical protein